MAPRAAKAGSAAEEGPGGQAAPTDTDLSALRSLPEFAAVVQWVMTFARTLYGRKEELDIFGFEAELLGRIEPKVTRELMMLLVPGIGSNKARPTEENLEVLVRHVFMRRRPAENPLGSALEPESERHFASLSPSERVHILRWLCEWQMTNAEKFRERLGKHANDDYEWRADPIGQDGKGNLYYVFEDYRLYRRTDISIPGAKARPAPAAATKRSAKRARVTGRRRVVKDEDDLEVDDSQGHATPTYAQDIVKEWTCLCTSLFEWNSFVKSLKSSRNAHDRELLAYIKEYVLPVLEEQEAKFQRIREKQEKERLREALVYNRKRSSRISDREERRKIEEQQQQAEEQRKALLAEAIAREERAQAREARESLRAAMPHRPLPVVLTREQRIKEREMKRVLSESREEFSSHLPSDSLGSEPKEDVSMEDSKESSVIPNEQSSKGVPSEPPFPADAVNGTDTSLQSPQPEPEKMQPYDSGAVPSSSLSATMPINQPDPSADTSEALYNVQHVGATATSDAAMPSVSPAIGDSDTQTRPVANGLENQPHAVNGSYNGLNLDDETPHVAHDSLQRLPNDTRAEPAADAGAAVAPESHYPLVSVQPSVNIPLSGKGQSFDQ